MVEELKLAIKIDDASIEQSLLKQFANAQKMADKVVLDFKNVNFDDKQVEAKFKEMQKKAGQNPIDLTISDNALDMLGQIDKRLTEIFSIGKGKSFIDSSSITADIGKIENKINELDKKYEEAQKKLSSIGSGNISGKDVNLVDNEEFKKLSQEVSELKNQFDDLKTHMQLLDDYTVSTDRFFELQSQVETTTVKVSDLVEEFTKLSNAQKALSFIPQESNISSVSNPAIEQQNKLQEELKETQQQAEETKSALNDLSNIKGLKHYTDEVFDKFDNNMFGSGIGENRLGKAAYFFDEKNSSDWEAIGEYSKYLTTWSAEQVKIFDQTLGFTEEQINQIIKEFYSDVDEDIQEDYKFDLKNIMDEDLYEFKSKFGIELQDVMKSLGYDALKTNSGEYAFYNTDKLVREVQVYDQEANKIIDINNKVKESIKETSSDQTKDAFPSTEATASVEKTTQAIREENNALDETVSRAKQAASELTKTRDIVSQNWYRKKGTVVVKDSKGNDITRDTDEFSFVERLKNGQLQTVLATYDEETGKWAEQVINVRTAFEQVEKAIISADNKIASLEMAKERTLASHPGYDATADDNQIAIERKKRDELQATLNLYGSEKEYIFEIEAATKRIADNQERLNNKKQSQTNLRQAVSDEQFLKDWDAAIAENNKRDAESAKQASKANLENAKNIQAEWDKNIKAIHDYMDAMTKLNNLKAKDKGTGSEANQIALQTQNVEELKQAAWDARKNLSSIQAENPDIIAWKQWVDMMKLFDQASKGSAESAAKLKDVLDNIKAPSLDKYENRLASYQTKKGAYDATIARFKDGGWTSNTYLENVQAVKDAVNEYETLLNELKGKDASLVTSDDISKLDEYEKKIKDTIATVTNMSAAEKGYNFVSGQKELDKIHKLLNENSKMSSEAKAKIRAYYVEIESGNPSMSLDRIHGEIMKIYNAEVEAGRAGRSFFDTLKNSGFHQLAAQMSGMFGFYDVINIGKQAISTIVSLDDALLDLKKTTSMSSTELNNFYYSANDVAKQMGVTTKSIIEQASAWSRLGYSSNEQATEMAKLSSKFASISPGMDTDQAQEGMVSIMKAWQINPEDVEKEILDPINQLGNKFAESNNDIVEGMKRSAAALAAVGTDYKDAYSLFTGVQEVLQNSEVAGRALRSISMRIRGYDENSEDGFEQTDDELKNITGDLIDLTKTAQHTQGVSIFKEGSTTEFKRLVDYFGEIHDIWDEMSQKQQNDFLQKAFGKTQAQAGAALIQNYDAVKEALAEIDESAGSADKEMSTVEQTLSYKINALKETWVGCAQQILDRGDLGIVISGLNGVSKVITGLIDNVGLLKTVAMGVTAALSFKNVGGNKMHFPMNILDNIHNLLWIQRFRVCYP